MTKLVTIKTHSVGTNFGTCATVRLGRDVLHTTDTYAYGASSVAYNAAEEWADRNGYLTERGAKALADARVEYSSAVNESVRHPAPDGRRVLTSAHCGLSAAIQDFERNMGFENLEAMTAECRRVREMWAGIPA